VSSIAPSESSAITQNRRELKFKLSEARATAFAAEISARIPKHRFQGSGANRLPRARHYVTTVYFDTAARDLYRAVRADPDSLKVRAREYYDLHPELLELATDARDIVRYTPVLWVEIKGNRDGRTYKRRIGIPKGDVEPFFTHGAISPAMRGLLRSAQPPKLRDGIASEFAAAESSADEPPDVIAELSALRARFSEPLRASCLVNYRRTAFEDAAGMVRITFDQRMACFAAPPGLWSSNQPLVREALGTPAYEEPSYVLEVKSRGELPGWLSELIVQAGVQPHVFSKFVTASETVYGLLPDPARSASDTK
jgi:hypothetical protein